MALTKRSLLPPIVENRLLAKLLSPNTTIGASSQRRRLESVKELIIMKLAHHGLDEGLIASFPCRSEGDGNWQIAQGVEHDDFGRAKIETSVAELRGERAAVADLLNS